MAHFLDDLPQSTKDLAERNNIRTAEEAIITPQTKFHLIRGCSSNDIRVLKQAASKIVAQRMVPVSELINPPWALKWSRITFGCAALDRCTRGGLVTRGITEICGAAGSGKTQILLQLSLTVQLPSELGGLGKSVAYICTEDLFPSKRMLQMAKSFAKRYPEQEINFLGNVYIEHVIESEDLLKCVGIRLKKLMENRSIGLIIIDSVAAVFRIKSNYIQRAQEMRKLANHLLHYADNFNCAVVCVNQVSSVGGSDREVPCLGLAWAHLGRTRFKVSKIPKQLNIKNQLHTVRRFETLYSPETPHEYADFLINEHGVVNVP